MTSRGVAIITAASFALAMPSHAAASSAAYRTLRDAHIFSFGGVGITGVRTGEEKAFDTLSHSAEFAQQLRTLLVEATTVEGRMYALYGLRQLRVHDYWALSKPCRRDHSAVNTAFGCIVGRQPVSDLVSSYIDHAYPR